VKVHEHRRLIDAAQETFNDKARRTEGKDASAKEFEEARAAGDALKKEADAARQYTKLDPKFATFITELDASLAKERKAMDDRWTLLAVDKHRGTVEEARRGLTDAMGPLNKESTDAQFDAANKAAAEVGKRLEEGKVFEPRDAKYRTDAEATRKELNTSKKKIDDLWTETGFARLKAEIQPAHKDLIAAGKALRARKPTADQLAEARTAGIVVRALVEKFEEQGKRIPALGQYLGEVKVALVEVEVQLETRMLDAAKGDLNAALKSINARAPTDENFQEVATATTVLEKTLETVHQKDPAMSAVVGDVKLLLKDTKAAVAKRRMEVDILRQKAKVEESKKIANDLIKQMNAPTAKADLLVEAEAAVKLIKGTLDEGTPLTKKDRDYAAYDKETKDKIKDFNDRIAARRVSLAAGDGRTILTDAVTALKAKLEAAKMPEASDADVGAAVKALEALGKAVDGQMNLEKQDAKYAAAAERARNDFMRFAEGVEMAKQARELRRQTIEAFVAGATAAQAGTETKSLRGQKEQYEKATAQFKSCSSSGGNMIRENTLLEKVALFIEGVKKTPKEVIAICIQRAEATDALLKQVVPLIAFDEGPKKTFEKGKALLADGKEGDALKQFDECISSGLILQNRSPELKERKFDVGGGSFTLVELTQKCIAQRKALKGK
jgi:hypothetical protein